MQTERNLRPGLAMGTRPRWQRWAALLVAGHLVCGPSLAQTAKREVAFVANSEDGTVTLVDVQDRAALGTLDVNPARTPSPRPGTPNFVQETEASPDGRTLYVSRGYLGDVAAFDLASRKLLWNRSINTLRADHMTVSHDGLTLFVSALVDNRVYRLDARSGQITGMFLTGTWPHDVKMSGDGRLVYNTSLGEIPSAGFQSAPHPEDPAVDPFVITIADAATLQIVDRIKLDVPFRPWAFAPDGRGIYAQLSNQRAVVAYDLDQRKVVRRLELPVDPGRPIAAWVFESPHHGLALSPDGQTLCLAGREENYVALVRAPELSLIKTIGIGEAPGWAKMADAGRLCLLPNQRSGDLSIVSIPGQAELARLPMGKGPRHVDVGMVPSDVIAAFAASASPKP